MNQRQSARAGYVSHVRNAYCHLVEAKIPPTDRFLQERAIILTLSQVRAYLPDALKSLAALRPSIVAAAQALDTPEIRAHLRFAEAFGRRNNRSWVRFVTESARQTGAAFDITAAAIAFTQGRPVEEFVFVTLARAPEAAA